ncbi:hypothetical protein DMA12_26460 [Amycolatopsis balhimycina DSM 5908]|uniref:Uncharacterized protein n=1 Tax=Amycolatopsis balhimycina DSM 5908 TaxID=1081091 RepID=A0A428WCE8_AMYBA|nr:hypothetical protein [Amycolatopsis balhimycina]RSM40761.1 hypothetical protein DMA12_26460 [Amycolatopsis balhimycina DSM 5908]
MEPARSRVRWLRRAQGRWVAQQVEQVGAPVVVAEAGEQFRGVGGGQAAGLAVPAGISDHDRRCPARRIRRG